MSYSQAASESIMSVEESRLSVPSTSRRNSSPFPLTNIQMPTSPGVGGQSPLPSIPELVSRRRNRNSDEAVLRQLLVEKDMSILKLQKLLDGQESDAFSILAANTFMPADYETSYNSQQSRNTEDTVHAIQAIPVQSQSEVRSAISEGVAHAGYAGTVRSSWEAIKSALVMVVSVSFSLLVALPFLQFQWSSTLSIPVLAIPFRFILSPFQCVISTSFFRFAHAVKLGETESGQTQ